MISFRYVKKGALRKEELEGLHNLCLEEEQLHEVVLSNSFDSDYQRRLRNYGKINKFKFNLDGFSSENYWVYKEKYNFVIAKDRKGKLLGYICFEHSSLDIEDEIKDLIIIKHLYISNAANHTNIDYTLFWLMENVYDKCCIYSKYLYRPVNEFNDFCFVTKPFKHSTKMGIKFKYSTKFPLFWDKEIKAQLNKLGYFEVTDLKRGGWFR